MLCIVYRNKAVTFIELLVVCVILSVVSLAVYATFNNGIKIWQRINSQVPKEDLNIFLDKFASSIKNSFKFRDIKFSGSVDQLSFPTLVSSQQLNIKSVGQMTYIYNPSSRVLQAEEMDFSQVYVGKKGRLTHSLGNIRLFKFQYFVYDVELKKYFWRDELSADELPLSVKLELELEDETGINKFVKTVNLPTQNLPSPD